MDNFKEQLAPSWSPVNIGLMVLGFIIAPTLGILMILYIVLGAKLQLDLRDLSTFTAFFRRLGTAAKAAIENFKNPSPRP
jgi:hypothetical protein